MKAIILQELKHRRISIVWWIVGIAAYNALNLLTYGTIKANAAQLNQALDNLPSTLKSFLAGTNDIMSPAGYLNAKMYYLMLPLIFSILAIGLGASLLAREEQNHTLELLLARPISRARLFAAKALAGLAVIGIVSVGTIVSILVGGSIGGVDISLGSLLAATLVMIAFTLVLGSIAYFLTALGRSGRGASIGIAVIIGLAGYITESLSKDITWLAAPSKVLPFHYYQPLDALKGGSWFPDFAGFLVVSAIFFVAGVYFFRRRDISG